MVTQVVVLAPLGLQAVMLLVKYFCVETKRPGNGQYNNCNGGRFELVVFNILCFPWYFGIFWDG